MSSPKYHHKSTDFLDLAQDDYVAARLLLRSGFLPQGVVVAATAVEKYLKAALAVKKYYSKKHLDSGLIQIVEKLFPDLSSALNTDFLKYLKRGFMLRYAIVDSDGFSIIINQYRTLIALDETVANIDKGFLVKHGVNEIDTPLRRAMKAKEPTVFIDNVPLGGIGFSELAQRPNMMYELKVDHKLASIKVTYQTEALNIIGDFCKKPDLSARKTILKLSLG